MHNLLNINSNRRQNTHVNSSRYNTNVKSLFLSLVRGFLARVLVFYFLRYRRHCNCSPVEKKTRTRSAVFTARVGRSINNKVKRSLANGRKITGLGLSRFARREQTSKNNSVSILFLRCESRHTVRTIHLEILRTILLQMQTASEPLCESQWVSSRRAHEEARESSKERHGHRFTDVSLKLNSTASPFYVFLLSLSLFRVERPVFILFAIEGVKTVKQRGDTVGCGLPPTS